MHPKSFRTLRFNPNMNRAQRRSYFNIPRLSSGSQIPGGAKATYPLTLSPEGDTQTCHLRVRRGPEWGVRRGVRRGGQEWGPNGGPKGVPRRGSEGGFEGRFRPLGGVSEGGLPHHLWGGEGSIFFGSREVILNPSGALTSSLGCWMSARSLYGSIITLPISSITSIITKATHVQCILSTTTTIYNTNSIPTLGFFGPPNVSLPGYAS